MIAITLLLLAAPPAMPRALAACNFVKDGVFLFNEDCDDCFKINPREIGRQESSVYEVRTLSYGMGANASFIETYWLADAKKCTAVGLEIEGGADSPVSTAVITRSREGLKVNDAELQRLLRFAKMVAFDASHAADQLAAVTEPPAAGKQRQLWQSGGAVDQRMSWSVWEPERGKRFENSVESCPCFRLWAGSSYKKRQSLQLEGATLHLYATDARNQSWAYALERDGKTRWGDLGMQLRFKALEAKDKTFRFETQDYELRKSLIEVSSEAGELKKSKAK